MDLISWALVKEGGPWAALLMVLATVSYLVWKGVLVPGPLVDRSVAGYVETIRNLREELVFWRAAAQAKDGTIQAQADQLHKLMAYSAVGTHALDAILEEARKREVA